jgi:alpha,alpha-trehalase
MGKNMETIETTNIIPVDLNCLLLQLERTLLKIYRLRNDVEKTGASETAIQARENAIQHYCWNETTKFYFDYNHVDQSQTDKLTLAAVYPLFFQLASERTGKRCSCSAERKIPGIGGCSNKSGKYGPAMGCTQRLGSPAMDDL